METGLVLICALAILLTVQAKGPRTFQDVKDYENHMASHATDGHITEKKS